MPNKSIAREYKSFRFSVKATDDAQGLIEAYGSIFDVLDLGDGWVRDIVKPGAFKRTIQNNKSRVQAGKANFLSMMLWNHDTEHFLPIGGWYDLKEDTSGLLGKGKIAIDTNLGNDVYKLIKGGFIDEFSIGYDIPDGGAHYDKDDPGVRYLTELRLWEISPVIFAMNQEALLVGVKSMDQKLQIKSVCGDTSLPIGPRDASWSGSTAHSQIVSWATKEDGTIDPSKMKKVHLKVDGEVENISSYGYPFCNITDGDPIINVGGVKACAGALSGARGADAGGDTAGMQAKVTTMYNRINKKYPDDTPLVPPWKEKAMGSVLQRKTLLDHYNEEMCEDLLGDWSDVYLCSLTKAIMDAYTIGDEVAVDIGEALDAFKALVLEKFVPQTLACDLARYIADNSINTVASMMLNGENSGWGYMSQASRRQQKRGAAISAANQELIKAHCANIKSMVAEHSKAITSAADDFATTIQGAEQPYTGADPGTPEEGQQEGKGLDAALQELRLLRK
jgi:HK97 family phage prohead protease